MYLSLATNRRFLVLGLLLTVLDCIVPEQGWADSVREVEQIKQKILEWSDSLTAFSGEFHLERMRESDTAPSHFDIVYRWDGENAYFQSTVVNDAVREVETFAVYNGTMEQYSLMGDDGLGIAEITGRDSLPFPWGVYILPDAIFGQHHELSLREVLSSGDSVLLQRDGNRVLSHINRDLGRAVDIYLDAAGHVTRYEWSTRPYELSQDEARALWPGDQFNFRILNISLDLSSYAEIDGVAFPLQVTKTWWQLETASVATHKAMFDTGEITHEEFFVRLCNTPKRIFSNQTFRLDEAAINPVLTDEDFHIEWPEGTEVHTDAQWNVIVTPEEFAVADNPHGYFSYLSIGVGVVSGIVLVAAASMLWRRRGKTQD